MAKQLHVVSHPKGGWRTEWTGASKRPQHFTTQAEAARQGRDMARRDGAELLIHGRNGRLRARNRYGHDAYPPQG